MKLLLFTGDRQYSSWSMRAKVALVEKAIPFVEVPVPLEFHVQITNQGVIDAPQTRPEPATGCMCDRTQLLHADPTGILRECFISSISRLPILLDSDRKFALSDSIAIAEYAEELAPQSGVSLLPGDAAQRARIRSFALHIHGDFLKLHEEMSYPRSFKNYLLSELAPEPLALAHDVASELDSILRANNNPAKTGFTDIESSYLFGQFSLVDVELAPLAQIFFGWDFLPHCSKNVQKYLLHLRTRPSIASHLRDAYALYQSRERFPKGSAPWIAHHYRFHPDFRIIHNFRSDVCHKLETETAWEMFILAYEGLGLMDIAHKIAEVYGIHESQALSDTNEFFALIDPERDPEYSGSHFIYS